MRPRRVRADADQLDLEGIGRRGEGPFVDDHLPNLEATIHMTAENCRDAVERSALQDRERALADFLGRLKHDQHVALCRRLCEQRRRPDRPGRVHVVSAGVHHARNGRRERQVRRLLNRQRVDVAANGNDRRAGTTSRHAGDDAGLSNSPNVGNSERAKRRRQPVGRCRLLERQLRIGVDRPAQPAQLLRGRVGEQPGNSWIESGRSYGDQRRARGPRGARVRLSTRSTSTSTPMPGRSSGTCTMPSASIVHSGAHDVLFPVARAGREIAGQREVRQRRQRHVVRAADAALQHATAPHGNSVRLTQVMNRLRYGESADSARLDVDDPPRRPTRSCPRRDRRS